MDVIVENLTKSFENQKAVDSISFQAKRGEILGFLHERDLGRVAELHAAVVFRNGTLDLHYIA